MGDRPPNVLKEQYDRGFEMVAKALAEEEKGNISLASTYYTEASQAFLLCVKLEVNPKTIALLNKKIEGFLSKAESFKHTIEMNKMSDSKYITACELFKKALIKDENMHINEAKELYHQCAVLYMEILESKDHTKNNEIASNQSDMRNRVDIILKRIQTLNEFEVKENNNSNNNNNINSISNTNSNDNKGNLTEEEIRILKETSIINEHVYLPWIDEDLNEDFYGLTQYKETLLLLSDKQKEVFGGWWRPIQICESNRISGGQQQPKMILSISHLAIRQTIISDCSFVSSLSVCAYYELKFNKRLITQIIYPKKNGKPVYNPCGKYMIKLHLNGVQRKVLIDDRLPVDKKGQLICSYSINPTEFWVSIVEKAFLRAMGGYEFPGSNSGIDLHILTGWIPEYVSLEQAERERLWDRLIKGLEYGDCLCTISTYNITECKELGLVPSHAYAILRVVNVNGIRLVQLKNPWTHTRWLGKYGPNDHINWTKQLKTALNYEPIRAQNHDNGIFWMSYTDILIHFRTLYINWNPKLFKYRSSYHISWPLSQGPESDVYSFKDNPQFSILVDNNISDNTLTSVWLLLSRHVTIKEEEDHEFITLHLFKTDQQEHPNNNRIYFPIKPYLQGQYINNRHYLCRFDVTGRGKHHFIAIISQLKKTRQLYFTVRMYATEKTIFKPIPLHLPYHKKLLGNWAHNITPGLLKCSNSPQYRITFDTNVEKMILILQGPKDYFVNVLMLKGDNIVENSIQESEIIAKSKAFRDGQTVINVDKCLSGNYILIPCTYELRDKGSYFISIEATSPFNIVKLTK